MNSSARAFLILLASALPLPAQWLNVDGVQVPAPPPEHPRLYLRARDLPDLHRRTTALRPLWEELQQLGRTNRQIGVEVDAVRYLLDRDPEQGRRTAAAALELLRHAQFDPRQQDVTRPIGRMLVTGSIAYDWCYPVLTAEQKKAFLAEILRLAGQLESGYPPREIGWVTGHGSEWIIMRDMISAGLAIYDEFPEMYRLATNKFFGGLLPARNWWYPGGAFHQGSSYAETRFSSDLYPLWIFDRLGFGNVYHPSQEFVPYSWIYMRRPDNQLMRSGDGQSKEPKLRSLLVAAYYKDGYILSDYLKNPGIEPMSKIFEFLWADPDLKPLPIADLPLSRYFSFPNGWMVARTGWDAESVIAEMKTNIYNFGNHQHNDAGAFQIYYKGPLAIDSGVYEGANGAYGSPHHLNYSKRSIAHNTLLVYDPDEKFPYSRTGVVLHNDGGQRLPNDWREPRRIEDIFNPANTYKTGAVLGHDFGPDPQKPAYTYLKSDVTQAYSAKVKEVKRSFVFLNLNGAVPAAMIVFDRVVSANPRFKKYWLLHSMEEPEVRDEGFAVAPAERGWTGKLTDTALLPERGNLEIAKVGGPGKEFWVFDQNYPNAVNRGRPEDFEIGAWRVEISPKTAAATDYFLNVMQVMGRERAAALPVEKLESGDMVGVRVADRVVWFERSGERTNRTVTFTLKAAGKCLVTDLAEGAWQIRHDGQMVKPAVTVTGDAGTLYFDAAPGQYSLRR